MSMPSSCYFERSTRKKSEENNKRIDNLVLQSKYRIPFEYLWFILQRQRIQRYYDYDRFDFPYSFLLKPPDFPGNRRLFTPITPLPLPKRLRSPRFGLPLPSRRFVREYPASDEIRPFPAAKFWNGFSATIMSVSSRSSDRLGVFTFLCFPRSYSLSLCQ